MVERRDGLDGLDGLASAQILSNVVDQFVAQFHFEHDEPMFVFVDELSKKVQIIFKILG